MHDCYVHVLHVTCASPYTCSNNTGNIVGWQVLDVYIINCQRGNRMLWKAGILMMIWWCWWWSAQVLCYRSIFCGFWCNIFFQILGWKVSPWGLIYGKHRCFQRPVLWRDWHFKVPKVSLCEVGCWREWWENCFLGCCQDLKFPDRKLNRLEDSYLKYFLFY